jgi:hypothetical protein
MRGRRRCWPSNSDNALVALFTAILLAAIRYSVAEDAAQMADDVIATRYEEPIIHGSWYSKQDLTNLTSWELGPMRRPWCTETSRVYGGKFYKTQGGEVLYESEECRLVRMTGVEARTCLANKTLLFVGDSITRYHYLSFAHFLARGMNLQR